MFICKKTNNVIKTAGAGKQQNHFVESEEKQTTIVKYSSFFFSFLLVPFLVPVHPLATQAAKGGTGRGAWKQRGHGCRREASS